MKKLLYGAAYYDEYMPYDRLQQDVAMMKKARINTVGSQNPHGAPANHRKVFLISHMWNVLWTQWRKPGSM